MHSPGIVVAKHGGMGCALPLHHESGLAAVISTNVATAVLKYLASTGVVRPWG